MQNDILLTLTHLPDSDLVARVKALVVRDHDTTAEIVAHLSELDTRDVHLREGYSSLFVYCRDTLGFSAWEAYNRIDVARTARRFPVILGMLADGSLHLTAVRRLGPHLTPDNHREVLESARGKTKAGIEEIVARLSPQPDVPTSVRRLPTAEAVRAGIQVEAVPVAGSEVTSATCPASPGKESAGDAQNATCGKESPGSVQDSPSVKESAGGVQDSRVRSGGAGTPAAVVPLSPDRYKLQLTISGETLERLRLAKDMLGHAIPSGDDAAVVDRALRGVVG